MQLTRDRFEAQIAPELDVQQAELTLSSTEATLPPLRRGLANAVHRLGVLMGEHPQALYELLGEAAPIPSAPEEIAVGIPADLLRQRPDIRRAERDLAAQTARIGVATADLYPAFSIFGSIGLTATSDLFQSSNQGWSLGPQFRWNLFDGGRVRNLINVEDARTEQAYFAYEETVLFALEDVENALAAYVEEQRRVVYLERSVTAAERSVELVKTLYRTGLTDFQNVRDSERSLAVQQDLLAESQGLVVQALVLLYRALGGGWDPDPPKLHVEIRDQQENGEPIR